MKELEEKNRLRERLADLEHQQWVHWAKYMLNNFDNDHIERWWRQVETNYEDLTEEEKDSDREWADKVIGLIGEEYLISQKELEAINAALDEIKDVANHILTNRDAAPDIAIRIEVDAIKKVLGLK